ncbi:hypothetical protein Tco_0431138 [Tanacetum coccineum]
MPTRINLDHMGVDLDYVRCPMWDEDVEIEDHVFISYKITTDTWNEVAKWWKISYDSSFDLHDAVVEHVGEEDVVILHVGVQDTFWNKLTDGKYIRNKDVDANLGRNCTSLRADEVEDNGVDDRFKVKEGKVYPVQDPNVPWNQMQPVLGMKIVHQAQLKECMINYKQKVDEGSKSKPDKGKQKVDESSKSKPDKWTKSKIKKLNSPVKGNPKSKGNPKCKGRPKSKGTPTPKPTPKLILHKMVMHLGSLVTYKWIAKQFAAEVRKNPKISYKQMKSDVREKFLINDYRDQLLITNPGSTIDLEVKTLDGRKTIFKRMYICFKAMKDRWCRGCRRVIGLDGCFLSSTFRGEFLTTMGRDANNQMFPMAWAVGLKEAVRDLLPHSEHRMCTLILAFPSFVLVLEDKVYASLPYSNHTSRK